MDVNFTSFDKSIGYNCNNRKKPFYLLVSIIVIVSYAETKRKYLKLKEFFTSDGCTLWKIFWLILGCPHKPEYLPASIIHDWIIEQPETEPVITINGVETKETTLPYGSTCTIKVECNGYKTLQPEDFTVTEDMHIELQLIKEEQVVDAENSETGDNK